MKISIITATYNSSKHILHCIESINRQTYSQIEHIIIDGASKDNTLEIIKNSPNRITRIISEPDNGIYDALNKGITVSTGDIVGFLHADDVFSSNELIHWIAEQFKDSKIDGVYGNLVFVNKKNQVVRTWKSKPYNPKSLHRGWMPPHPTLFLRDEIYKRFGLFDSTFRIAGDYDFMLRIMLDPNIRLKYIPKEFIKMRLGGASTGNIKSLLKKSKEDIIAIKNNGLKFPLYILALKNLRKLPQILIRKFKN